MPWHHYYVKGLLHVVSKGPSKMQVSLKGALELASDREEISPLYVMVAGCRGLVLVKSHKMYETCWNYQTYTVPCHYAALLILLSTTCILCC